MLMNNPIIDQLNILNQIKLLIHSAALPESGCCCCDYHSEKSLYLLVQLQLHTSLAKKKSRWQHLADLGSHQKNVIFNIGEVQADRKLYFMDMKVLGGYQFSNLFCQKKTSSAILICFQKEANGKEFYQKDISFVPIYDQFSIEI